jgi:hypothetical protein
MAWRMVVLRSGWAAKVVATVPGDIGGSRLPPSLTGRGMWFSANKMFDGLVEAFEDIWVGWRDRLDACKLK